MALSAQYVDIIARNGLADIQSARGDKSLRVTTPITGDELMSLKPDTSQTVSIAIDEAKLAFHKWRNVPAPRRGEFVRLLGEALRENKQNLAELVTLECGKILSEGLGEVQEMIDICDFAVGLSRQLYGLTMPSERPGHHMRETWQPLGPVAVISAFNFPVAVWSWNTALALVCGNPVIWKPSDKTPLTALACQRIVKKVMRDFEEAPSGLVQTLIGKADIGEDLVKSPDIALVSATGSTRMGREVAPIVAARFGKTLLELGGNGAMIVSQTADIDMAVRAITFSAVGTCGQRCTTLRRLIVHEDIKEELMQKLKAAYESVRIGNPLDPDTLVGPLIDEASFNQMQKALEAAMDQGGNVHGGMRVFDGMPDAGGYYVQPALVDMPAQTSIVREETFAPILYVMSYRDFETAIELQNAVPQGLSSACFTMNVMEAERFLSATGSDCGIANINIGPSGAEIGGAFGGEKETGGGRESGSDAWKAYMRRQTATVNYSGTLPLAQGVKFDI